MKTNSGKRSLSISFHFFDFIFVRAAATIRYWNIKLWNDVNTSRHMQFNSIHRLLWSNYGSVKHQLSNVCKCANRKTNTTFVLLHTHGTCNMRSSHFKIYLRACMNNTIDQISYCSQLVWIALCKFCTLIVNYQRDSSGLRIMKIFNTIAWNVWLLFRLKYSMISELK